MEQWMLDGTFLLLCQWFSYELIDAWFGFYER